MKRAVRVIIGGIFVASGLLVTGWSVLQQVQSGSLWAGGAFGFGFFLVVVGLIIAGVFKMRDFY